MGSAYFETYFNRLVRTNILGLSEYKPGVAPDSPDAVRISANENNFGTPQAVLDAIISSVRAGGLNRYPDSNCSELKAALSEKFGFPPEWFIIGNGLDDIINLFAITLLEPGDEVIVPAVTFSVYASAARMMNAHVIQIPMRSDLSIDTDAIVGAITSRTKMIFLCTPNNPTGSVVSVQDFDRLLTNLDVLPVQPILVVDQAYIDYTSSDEDCADAVKYLGDHTYITVLRTFSKLSGLAGLRIGYAIAHPEMSSYLCRVRQPYAVNSLAQAAALVDVRDKSAGEFKNNAREAVDRSRRELERFFMHNKIAYVPSHANFVFAFFDQEYDRLLDISQKLADEGIFVRTLRHENAPAGLRFSIGTQEENQRLIGALDDLLPQFVSKKEDLA